MTLHQPILDSLQASYGDAAQLAAEKLTSQPYFRVRSVEVRGNQITPTGQIIASLSVGSRTSLWSNHRAARARVQEIPGVLDARIDRKLPGTLVVSVQEARPVARLQGEGVVYAVLDNGDAIAAHRLLSPMSSDLPWLDGEQAQVKGDRLQSPAARHVASTLPALLGSGIRWTQAIEQITPVDSRSFAVRIRGHEDVAILLPLPFPAQRASWIEATLKDFESRYRDTRTPRTLDLRYEDQIIVHFEPRP